MFEFLKNIRKKDNLFLALLILVFCERTVIIFPVAVIKHFTILGELIIPFLYLFLISTSCIGQKRGRWIRGGDVAFCAILVFAILLTFLIYPNTTDFLLEGIVNDIWMCIPFFLLGLIINIDENTDEVLSKWCCLGILLTTYYEMSYTSGSALDERGYSMTASYNLLLNGVIVANYAVRTRKIIPIVCTIVAIAYELLMGTRGPVVILVVAIAASIIVHTVGKWRYVLVIGSVALFFLIQSEWFWDVQLGMRSLTEDAGFSTRVFDWFLEDDLTEHNSGRSDIYKVLLQKLSERPILGYGIYGEWPMGFRSAHNMYLEIVFHWGWFIGSILIVCYVAIILKAFRSTNNRVVLGWLSAWSAFVFVRGIFGGMYLSFYVFFLLGFSLQIIRSSYNNKQLSYVQ